jgi:asparagine synthase (glutamine-hydrolysing)
MCGIAGIYFFGEYNSPNESLRGMASVLAHRGPDEEGFYVDGRIALAHRRLKIIDLTPAASQPMTDEQSRYQVLLNGEIYNFKQLRRNLESKYDFFSNSDTEVVLRLFQEQKEETWALLNGMFAVAVYDSHTQELFLARDHAGIKPLFYHQSAEKLIFGSELKALLASGMVALELDLESIGLYLQTGYFPGSRTPYRAIRKLKQGECARITSKGLSTRTYWSLRSFLPGESSSITGPAAAKKLTELLEESVQQQMISDVPLGAFLSGGIDSGLIVALMSKVSTSPVRTFTVGFSRMGYYDERPHAEKISTLFRTEHHEFVVDNRVEEIVSRLSTIFDEPFADSSAIPTLCLAELARRHVTVALSGTGGDEIFGGYRKYMAAGWSSLYISLPQGVRRAIKKTIGLLPASRKSLWRERALLLQRFSTLSPELSSLLQLNSIFTSGEVSRLLGQSAELEFPAIPNTVAENMMLFDYEYYLPDDLLVKEDRCTMAFGLEARVPYLDRCLVEFMTSLPVKYKVSRASTKRLFKKVASQFLPDWVIRRPKHGFGSPVAEWLRTDLRPMAEELLFGSRTYLKDAMIRLRFDEHQKGADLSRQLWALLMLEMWYQHTKA